MTDPEALRLLAIIAKQLERIADAAERRESIEAPLQRPMPTPPRRLNRDEGQS